MAELIKIKPQVIMDRASGLMLKFVSHGADHSLGATITIQGDFPFGNRDIEFTKDGEQAGASVDVFKGIDWRPGWLKKSQSDFSSEDDQ